DGDGDDRVDARRQVQRQAGQEDADQYGHHAALLQQVSYRAARAFAELRQLAGGGRPRGRVERRLRRGPGEDVGVRRLRGFRSPGYFHGDREVNGVGRETDAVVASLHGVVGADRQRPRLERAVGFRVRRDVDRAVVDRQLFVAEAERFELHVLGRGVGRLFNRDAGDRLERHFGGDQPCGRQVPLEVIALRDVERDGDLEFIAGPYGVSR